MQSAKRLAADLDCLSANRSSNAISFQCPIFGTFNQKGVRHTLRVKRTETEMRSLTPDRKYFEYLDEMRGELTSTLLPHRCIWCRNSPTSNERKPKPSISIGEARAFFNRGNLPNRHERRIETCRERNGYRLQAGQPGPNPGCGRFPPKSRVSWGARRLPKPLFGRTGKPPHS